MLKLVNLVLEKYLKHNINFLYILIFGSDILTLFDATFAILLPFLFF